jgi:hypothetical protein
VGEGKTHHKLTKNNPTLAQNLRGSQQFPVRPGSRDVAVADYSIKSPLLRGALNL